MSTATLPINPSEVKPLYAEERKSYRAHLEFHSRCQKYLRCGRCQNTARGLHMNKWRFCPFCGAEVQR
jgi:hypothetical protein